EERNMLWIHGHLAHLVDAWFILGRALILALAACWLAILFHEFGHAAAARLVGVRIWGVRLGFGPVLWRGVLGGCRFHIAALPFVAAVHLLDDDAEAIGYRDIGRGTWRFVWGPKSWRAPIISAAGGLANLAGILLVVLSWEMIGRPVRGTIAGDLILFTLGANIAGYLNLLPWCRSDGTHLLAQLTAARLSTQPVTTA
ncbi:MAG TPA: site-2 protease family protein, partial [Gemmatimonadales bacterium]